MAELNQLPGELNITIMAGDDFSLNLSAEIDLTEYEIQSFVISSKSKQTPIDIGEINLKKGELVLSLDSSKTKSLEENNKWTFRILNKNTGFERTLLYGKFIVKNIFN